MPRYSFPSSTRYPAEGVRYCITEWDGSKNLVTVLVASPQIIRFRYADGLVHEVDPDYFAYGLSACG